MKKNHKKWKGLNAFIKFDLKMKLTTLFLFAIIFSTYANNSYSQATKINLNLKSTTVAKVLDEIEATTQFRFVYNKKFVDLKRKVSIKVDEETIEVVLNNLFEETNTAYKVRDTQIILRGKEMMEQLIQEEELVLEDPIEIKGKVTDSEGTPLPGATIMEKGTMNGITSDQDGNYMLEVKGIKSIILVSYIGFETQEIIVSNKMTINVVLEPSVSSLNEVVVVGYGTTAVKDLTGAVSRISERQMEVKNVASVASLMQNMAAGVMVSGYTGRPGENVRVRVRGATSFSGKNEPLYVIDGVPSQNSDVLNAIVPSDIASVDILKDASASAIYGSRAANGVVMITTKRGRLNEKTKFSITYNSSVDEQIKNFSMLDGDKFRAYLTDLANKTLVVDPGNTIANNILDPEGGYVGDANINWFEHVKQAAWRHNLDLSIRGGSNNISYFISGSVMNHQGMVVKDNLSRYSARVNLDVIINKVFKIGTRISLSYTDKSESGTSLFSSQGHRPDLPIYKEDGITFYDDNPVAKSTIVDNTDEYSLSGNFYGELEIIKDLKLRSSLSVNQYMNYNYTFNPSYLSYYNEASAGRTEGRGYSTVFDNTLSYVKTFNDIHFIDFIGGISFENFGNQSAYLYKNGFAMDEIYTNVSAGTEFNRSGDSKNSKGLFSSFARFNYKYNDKYLVTLTARHDGSSMFGKNNRYGFFPSGAIAWKINKEDFLKDVSFINELKLKVSAGKTGIQNLTSYSNRDLYKATKYNDVSGIKHSQIGNKDIKWELSTLYDVGLDFTFFNYKLSGSIGYYLKNTNDLIRAFSFPSSMAVNNMYYNVGSVRNQGFELNLKANLINKKDLKLDLGINLATNKNTVIRLEEEGAIVNSSGTIVQSSGTQVLAVGYPMGVFFGYEYNGIIQNQDRIDELNQNAKNNGHYWYNGYLYPGNLEISDLNKDGKISGEDRTIIGSPDPDVFGGINTILEYKRFTIRANFGFQIGGKKVYGKALQNIPSQLTGLVDYNLYNRWSLDNTDSQIPASYLGQGVTQLTRLSIFDASYFRLQDVRISYDIPEINNFPLQGQIYFSVTNLFTLTSYPGTDPATVNTYGNFGGNYETSYPGIRTFSFGLKFNL
jgi:TonB-linked SusC/RagA family outer membrane protein